MDISLRNRIYYRVKPFIPRRIQLAIRRRWALHRLSVCKCKWPIDPQACNPRSGWTGWPGRKRWALILSHDVDVFKGHQKCLDLIRIEEELGFRSSFNFVPERYPVSPALRSCIVEKGFEVGVHGLFHDGRLYESKGIFQKRAEKINRYIREW